MNMKNGFTVFLLLAAPLVLPSLARAQNNWTLEKSTLTYHVSHPLHEVAGVSHAARGKGVCRSGECDFLVAAPVKSFDSGDSNRDLHMLQVVRGADFPMIIVRFSLPESELDATSIRCNLQIQFAGQTVEYKQVAFQQTIQGKDHRVTGTIPATVSDFKIDPPKLLMVPIKNEIPVDVDMTWTPDATGATRGKSSH
jgi:hypothetical protein